MKFLLPLVSFALQLLLASAAHAQSAPVAFVCSSSASVGAACNCATSNNQCAVPVLDALDPASSLSLCLEVDPALSLLGWQVDLEASGDAEITSFSFIDSLSSHVTALQTDPSQSLRINWLYEDPAVPWDHGVTCFGTLELRGGSGSWDLQVQASSHAVKDAGSGSLERVSVDTGVMLLPEPGQGALLAAGLVMLCLLAGRRHRGTCLVLLVLLGGAGGGRAEVVGAARSLTPEDLALAEVGSALARPGDLDQDGVDDLALGLPDADGGRGQVALVGLRRDGTVHKLWTLGRGLGGFPAVLPQEAAFGSAVTSIGDLDGNGLPELAVSAPGINKVWVLFLGPQEGVPGSVVVVASASIESKSPVYSLASPGDLDLDGLPDLVLGQPEYTPTNCSPQGACGMVSAVHLHRDGTPKSTQLEYLHGSGDAPPPIALDRFGAALTGVGDLDGDGVPDLAVGMPGYNGERGTVVLLLLGTASGGKGAQSMRVDDTRPGFPVTLQAGDLFGSALASPGDWNGDGVADLVIGAPGMGGDASGGAFLLALAAGADRNGLAGSVLNGQSKELPGVFVPGARFGSALTVVNFDGDRDFDLLIPALRETGTPASGLIWEIHLADGDGDGVPESIGDNCPDVSNPDQTDTDSDGYGDVCDNCVGVSNGPNAGICIAGDTTLLSLACSNDSDCNGNVGGGVCSQSQEDTDLNGVGDVCENAEVRVNGPYSASVGRPERHWLLELDCGAEHVTDLALASFQSDLSLPLDLHFSGCATPPALGGAGCDEFGATPGSRVGDLSGAIVSDPTGTFAQSGSVGGLRPNTLYTFLEGNAGPSNRRLCHAFETGIPLGWIGNPSETVDHLMVVPSQLDLVSNLVGAMEGESGPIPSFCMRNEPLPSHTQASSFTKTARSSLAPLFAPTIDIALNPALSAAVTSVGGAEGAGYQTWEVCFQSDEPINRIKFAIESPLASDSVTPRFSRSDMTWVGCDHTSVNNACTGTYEASGFLYPVTAAVSALYKPPGPPSDGRDNRLYPVVMGAKRGFSGASERLNALTNAAPYSDFWHCIGQIRVTGGTSASEEMPVVYVTGETYLSSLDPFCQDIDNGQDCTTNVFTDPDAYSVNMYCGVMVDNDNDGIRVEADNCPYVSNPMQHDSGSFKSDAPNGRDNVGDLCQCGEGDGDGIVSASGDGPWTNDDLQNLREHLVGTAVADFDEARCNLMDAPAESNTCDLLDALTLKQALEANPVPTGLPETCAAAGPP